MFRCEMAVSFSVNLSEEDIAVASLEGRNSAELHNDGLRFCLKIQGRQMQRAENKGSAVKTVSLNVPNHCHIISSTS